MKNKESIFNFSVQFDIKENLLFKIDDEFTALIKLFILFLAIQTIVFWNWCIYPTQDSYLLIKNGGYTLKTYKVPQEIQYEIKNIEAKNILDLELILDFKVVQRINCAGITTAPKNIQICDAFLDQDKKVTQIQLYKRSLKGSNTTTYEMKGLDYENSKHQKITVDVKIRPYESSKYLSDAKFKFVMSAIGSAIFLLFFFFCY